MLKTYMGVMEMARRDTFIIDPQGRVAKHYESVDPEGHSQVVLEDIKALKAAAARRAADGTDSADDCPPRPADRPRRSESPGGRSPEFFSALMPRSSPSSVSGNMRSASSWRAMPIDCM